MSRHHCTGERSSTSRTSSIVSTSVPTWGCRAWTQPVLGAQLVELGEHADEVVPLRRRRAANRRRPARRRRPTVETNVVAPAAANSSASARAAASVALALRRGRGGRAARSRRSARTPWRSSTARSAAGVARAGTRARRARRRRCRARPSRPSTRSASSIDAPAGHLAHAPGDRPGADPVSRPWRSPMRVGALQAGGRLERSTIRHSTPARRRLSRVGGRFVGALYCPRLRQAVLH